MHEFFEHRHEAALTTLGYFWKALWAFVLGYIISGCIQVFVPHELWWSCFRGWLVCPRPGVMLGTLVREGSKLFESVSRAPATLTPPIELVPS